jgi:dihydrofolate synthase/folylpolyglutamate synthase
VIFHVSRTDLILQRLLTLHPKLIDLTLDRIDRLLEQMGRPQDRLPPVIHVAGTNGKGSTVAYLRAFLEAAGQRVHVYTSPQLVDFRERIRLDGKLVTRRALNDALEYCEAVNGGKNITYFEITTAAAIKLFADVPADYLLLEVGLGGRYDATNVVAHPLGAVITPVSIDHVEYLGPTVKIIAREKAGIIKRGAPLVVGRQTDDGLASITGEAELLGVTPFIAGSNFDGFVQNGQFVYQDDDGLLDLPLPALRGAHQIDNAALAIAALRRFGLPVTPAQIAEGLRKVEWPARLQLLRGKLSALLPKGHELWLDGGHNEAGGNVLAQALRDMDAVRKRPLVLVMGTFANKDAKGFLAHFGDAPVVVLTLKIPGERASWTARQLADLASAQGLNARPMRGIEAALREAAMVPDARVVICGSLHLAGEVLRKNGTPPV